MSADETAIKALIDGFASNFDGKFIAENSVSGSLFIRPSGNPIATSDFPDFIGGDVKITEAALVKLHKLDIGTDMAFAALTHSAKFTYKGTPNDDPSYTMTFIFKKMEGTWKIAWAQRSTYAKSSPFA